MPDWSSFLTLILLANGVPTPVQSGQRMVVSPSFQPIENWRIVSTVRLSGDGKIASCRTDITHADGTTAAMPPVCDKIPDFVKQSWRGMAPTTLRMIDEQYVEGTLDFSAIPLAESEIVRSSTYKFRVDPDGSVSACEPLDGDPPPPTPDCGETNPSSPWQNETGKPVSIVKRKVFAASQD